MSQQFFAHPEFRMRRRTEPNSAQFTAAGVSATKRGCHVYAPQPPHPHVMGAILACNPKGLRPVYLAPIESTLCRIHPTPWSNPRAPSAAVHSAFSEKM